MTDRLINFETAKLAKEKGFDLEIECFYSKHGALNWLTPQREYEHLHSYYEQIESYFTGKYNWNSLNADEGMVSLKTAFSECSEWCNCECSAPEQSLLQRWLREVHNLHIYIDTTPNFGNMESHKSKYKSSVKVPFKPFKWTTGVYYLGDTYEEALEKGLVAALKLL